MRGAIRPGNTLANSTTKIIIIQDKDENVSMFNAFKKKILISIFG